MQEITVNNLLPFDVLLVAKPTWLSKAIRRVTNAEVSHTGIILTIDGVYERLYYIHESDKGGLRNVPLSYYTEERKDYEYYIARPKIKYTSTDILKLLHITLCDSNKYDIASLVLHQPIRWLWKELTGKDIWTGREIEDNNRFTCSERSGYILNGIFNIEPEWYKLAPVHYMGSDKYIVYKLKV